MPTERVRRNLSMLDRMIRQGRSFSARERNCCFLNAGPAGEAEGRFANISAISGLDFPDDGRAVALTDWDHDGDVDLWISNRNAPRLRFLRNDTPTENHSLSLRLTGNGTTTSRDAIGARVEVHLAASTNQNSKLKTQNSIRTLRAGEGFLAQSSKWLHFGLGDAERIEKVVVRWPDGQVEPFVGLAPDGRYRLVQGAGRPNTPPQTPRPSLVLEASTPRLPPATQIARIPLFAPVTLPPLPFQDFDGTERRLPMGSGKSLLVNLWASWCTPCRVELNEITRRREEIRDAGIDVVALTVDGLVGDKSKPAAAAELIEDLGWPFTAGRATARLVATLQNLHDEFLTVQRRLPVPTSFLIGTEGQLTVIYKGPIDIDQMIRDLDLVAAARPDRFKHLSPFAGRHIDHDVVRRNLQAAEAGLRIQLGAKLLASGYLDHAFIQYGQLLKLTPPTPEIHLRIAKALRDRRHLDHAKSQIQQALEIEPNHTEALFQLGMIFLLRGEVAEGKTQFERVLAIDPEHAPTHNNLGNLLLNQGDLANAKVHIEHALRIRPNYVKALISLGNYYYKADMPDQAIAQYEQILRINPDYEQAHNKLGNVYLRQGNLSKALSYFVQVVRISPYKPGGHLDLARALVMVDDFERAKAHLDRALRIQPNFARAHYMLGYMFERKGEPNQAKASYKRAFDLARKQGQKALANECERRLSQL